MKMLRVRCPMSAFEALSTLGLVGCAAPYHVAELQLMPERITVNGQEVPVLGDGAGYVDSTFAVSAEVVPRHFRIPSTIYQAGSPSSVSLHVQNWTPEVCEVIWDRSGVVDIRGHTVEVVRGETRRINELEQQRANIVLPRSKSTVTLYPLEDGRDLLGLDSFPSPMDGPSPFYRDRDRVPIKRWADMVATIVGHPVSVTATFRFPTRCTRTVLFEYRISEVSSIK